ncbi:MAG: 3'-5' exonuclease [Actinomycetota bacterium]
MRWARAATRAPSGAGDDAALWAIDLEMTGLDPAVDHIIEVAAVPIRGRRIRLGEAWSTRIRPERYRPNGTVAHQLMPVDLADGAEAVAALDALWQVVGDDALLFHFASIDIGFLQVLHERIGRPWPRPAVVDTLDLLERRNRRRRQVGDGELPLQLDAARAALGLPAHDSHRALGDAVATAELWLALTAADAAHRDR